MTTKGRPDYGIASTEAAPTPLEELLRSRRLLLLGHDTGSDFPQVDDARGARARPIASTAGNTTTAVTRQASSPKTATSPKQKKRAILC